MIALLALVACGGGASDTGALVLVSDVQSQVSEVIPTVVTVTWTTDVAAVGHVEFGDGLSTPEEESAATSHMAVLVGLPPGEEASYRVVMGGDAGDEQHVTTGNLSVNLPALTVEGGSSERWLVNSILGAATGPTIISPEGRFVWYYPDDRGLDVYRARVARDGRGILYNAGSISGDPSDASELVRVSWDGTQVERYPVPLLAHDFVEHEDGTLGAIQIVFDGDLRGDRIVEIDPLNGDITEVWSAWDCFDPDEIEGDDPEHGWTFANGLDYDADTDAYLISLRNFSGVVSVDRATGACNWVFGGEASTFDIEGDVFMHEHQFEKLPDGFLVFDNDGAPGNESRVLEYAVDWQAQTATQTWSYQTDPAIYSFVLGDVDRMDDGDTLITWSAMGQVNRVTPAGESTWQLNADLGYAFGFQADVAELDARPW